MKIDCKNTRKCSTTLNAAFETYVSLRTSHLAHTWLFYQGKESRVKLKPDLK